VAEEEAGVDGGGGARQSATSTTVTSRVESDGDLESSGDLESFEMKSKMIWGRVLFISSKISAAVLI
jgi:hypothetical protein